MQRFLRSVILAACALVLTSLFARPLLAQIDTGGITGTVKDSSGAVVAGAKLTLTNDATGVRVRMDSTSTGTYFFGGLLPATYTLEAQSSGFTHYIVHGLVAYVQQVLTIDVPLSAGSVQQQVTVTAAAPLLQAENAAVGQTINTETVNDLPLATRNWGSLARLSAGVSTAPPGPTYPGLRQHRKRLFFR